MWTKRVATEMSGRDPLGLSRVGDLIKDFLLSGINTNNTRARYYSFYTWALWHIEREERARGEREFTAAFRRREATMALATLAHDPASSTIGIKRVGPRYDTGIEAGVFDCDFKVLKNALGGYGQYYTGSLNRLGLVHRPENSFDVVRQGAAEGLAESFQAAIENTPYVRKRLYKDTKISKRDLLASAEGLTLDALDRPECREERRRLIEIFFGLDGGSFLPRRDSLALILHALTEYEQYGIRPDASRGHLLDKHLLYAFYYGALLLEGKTVQHHVPEPLVFCRDMWRQFCLHQFLTQAAEGLLRAVLEVLTAEPAGLTLDEVVTLITAPDFRQTLADAIRGDCQQPRDLLAAFGVSDIPDEATSISLRKTIMPTHRLSETRTLNWKSGGAAFETARAVLLLATLYAKWRGAGQDLAFNYVSTRAGQDLWAGSLLPSLDRWLDAGLTWEESLRELIEVFILNQHDRVMYEKGKLDSSWVQRAGGRIVKEQDYKRAWRSSRHLNAVLIMRDLGLVRFSDGQKTSITPPGRKVLDRALRLSRGTQEE
ncbi:MAG TPA: hypothetical protein VF297_24430 [Pyrinomonadaceae bacterium]